MSGLTEARNVLTDVKGVATIEFTEDDVVRHPLVQRIVKAYAAYDLRRNPGGKRPG
jgi:phosphate starvation-inducible PhoH-like protein